MISSESVSQEAVITVADLGEFGLIAAIRAVLRPDASAVVGVGDDAAVLPVFAGGVVVVVCAFGVFFVEHAVGMHAVGVRRVDQYLGLLGPIFSK